MYSTLYNILTINSSGGSPTIDVNDGIQLYIIETGGVNVTLSGNYSIGYTGVPIEGTIAQFDYRGTVTLNGYNVSILGRQLTQEEVNSKLRIYCEWNGTSGSWNVIVIKENNINDVNGIGTITLTAGGGIVGLIPGVDKKIQHITGSPLLTGDWVITQTTSSYNPKDGDEFTLYYKASPTPNTHTVTIFGVVLTDDQIKSGNLIIFAKYKFATSSWVVTIINDVSAAKTITTTNISDEANREILIIPVSFESNEQGDVLIAVKHNYIVEDAFVTITKTLAGTNSGYLNLITNYSWGGANGIVPGTTLAIGASTAVGSQLSWFTGLNYTMNLGTYNNIGVTASKTTAGGRAIVTLIIRKIQ